MTLDEAVAADRRGEIVVAIHGYEALLGRGIAPLELLMNLAVLHWQVTDPGLAAAHAFGPDALKTAFRRSREVIAEAERRFPESAEPRFWRHYFAWADFREAFDPETCRTLLREDTSTIVPYFHLFALSHGAECEPEAVELLRRFKADPTGRGRYISSVIEGVLRRKRCSRPIDPTC